MSYNYSGAYASTIVIIEFQFVKFYQVFIVINNMKYWQCLLGYGLQNHISPQKLPIFS